MQKVYFIHFEQRHIYNQVVLDSWNACNPIFSDKKKAISSAVERVTAYNQNNTEPNTSFFYTICETTLV